MSLRVSGKSDYLKISRTFTDYMQNTQTYATAGWSTDACSHPLTTRKVAQLLHDHAEIGLRIVGRFQAVKYLSNSLRKLASGTGSSKNFYNTIGRRSPSADVGRTYYYADYRRAVPTNFIIPPPFPAGRTTSSPSPPITN